MHRHQLEGTHFLKRNGTFVFLYCFFFPLKYKKKISHHGVFILLTRNLSQQDKAKIHFITSPTNFFLNFK